MSRTVECCVESIDKKLNRAGDADAMMLMGQPCHGEGRIGTTVSSPLARWEYNSRTLSVGRHVCRMPWPDRGYDIRTTGY